MKTKVLISFAVTVKLICAFVFALAKIHFSHDVAHIKLIAKPKGGRDKKTLVQNGTIKDVTNNLSTQKLSLITIYRITVL